MNATFSTLLPTSISNSSTVHIEIWFIPFDILCVICLSIVIILAILFLLTIAIDHTCHTVSMMLVANSCLAALLCASDLLWSTVNTLANDLNSRNQEYALCMFGGYLTFVSIAIHNYSFLLQAFYRYVTVVHSTRLFWGSRKCQLILIGLAWLYALLFPIAFVFTGDLVYNMDNQICEIPLRLSFALIFCALCIYGIPMLLMMLIYFKLIQYVKEIRKRVTPVNILFRARSELTMVQRTIMIVMILITSDFPYAVFLFMSFFTAPPQYHFRIAVICVDVSLVCVMIVLFQFTDPLKTSIMKYLQRRPNAVIPTIA